MKSLALALVLALTPLAAAAAPPSAGVGPDGHGLPPAGTPDPREATIRDLERQLHDGQPDIKALQGQVTQLKLAIAELQAERNEQADRAAFGCVALDLRGGADGCLIHPQSAPAPAPAAPPHP